MPVEFPDLSSAKCVYFTLCGEVAHTDVKVPEVFLGRRKWQVARYERSEQAVFVRVGWTPKPKHSHLHIELTKEEWFATAGSTPPATITTAEIDELFACVDGASYKAEIDGEFIADENSLPAFVTSVLRGSRGSQSGVEVVLSGFTLSIRGAPIHQMKWERKQDPTKSILTLTGRAPERVSGDLLVNAVDTIETAFSAISPGASGHG